MPRQSFQLFQHTPLIHFHAQQPGAFLRATEVKPRFDRYLAQQLGTNAIPPHWLVGFARQDNKAMAFNYRMRIVAQDVQWFDINEVDTNRKRFRPYPAFFANTGTEPGSDDVKFFSFTKKPVRVVIDCLIPELREQINKHFPTFVATNNFMTRKTKGFGSFTVIDATGSDVLPDGRKHYSFELDRPRGDLQAEFKGLFEYIDVFYRTLRSGLNEKADRGATDLMYFKSLLFKFAIEQKHQWDKREMRRELFLHDRKFQEVERKRSDPKGTVQYNSGTPYLYRDMMGLATSTSWMSYKATVKKDPPNQDLNRYPSPLTIKPVLLPGGNRYRIYLIPELGKEEEMTSKEKKMTSKEKKMTNVEKKITSVEKKMTNVEFTVSAGSKAIRMKTPPEFSITKYLDYAAKFFRERSVADHVGRYDRRVGWKVRLLSDIYSQLTSQYPKYNDQ
ncbi:hypothetical protein GGR28_002951 [Lewinella aquimaris]|uniref:Uncharacterized protein n=1 Tax=Neolewinella aquimaris TaxID=1835722 RepID=A0A840EA92_9BACT|nr:hypothetical protein [Neolewinella aquimaris]MBB4080317.1 hypothetical protein [Neolewinella aquimaris]